MVEQLQRPTDGLTMMFHGLETDDIPWPSNHLLWLAFSARGAGWKIVFRNSFLWNAEVILRLVPPVLKELAVDGVIVDQVSAAGGTAAARAGLPFVTVCTAMPWNEDLAQPPPFTLWPYEVGLRARIRNWRGYRGWRWFMRPTLHALNRYRDAWGLPRFRSMDDSYSPLAQISQLFTEMDFPRSTMPDCFHNVGSLAADRQYGSEGFPWEKLDGRPLIYASLGTIADPRNRPIYPKIAAACQGLAAQLVLARGKWNDSVTGREASHDLPGNPLTVDFAPQLALLDRAAVLVTHAGSNTVLEAISRGVPMVALPRSSDQPGTAARLARAGAGLCLSFRHSTPQQLRSAIERVLSDAGFRRRAGQLQVAMRAAGGAPRAADIAEQALTTGRPVLRSRDPIHNNHTFKTQSATVT
jgi:MGT family glycosyltransferase